MALLLLLLLPQLRTAADPLLPAGTLSGFCGIHEGAGLLGQLHVDAAAASECHVEINRLRSLRVGWNDEWDGMTPCNNI